MGGRLTLAIPSIESDSMPRPRIPQERATVTGADKVHPARFAKRSDPKTTALGLAPAWMDGDQIAAWESFRSEIPWLMESDRGLMEIAAKLRARNRTDPEMGVSAMNQLRMCLAQMGATPADRTKVAVPDEPEADKADRFFN